LPLVRKPNAMIFNTASKTKIVVEKMSILNKALANDELGSCRGLFNAS